MYGRLLIIIQYIKILLLFKAICFSFTKPVFTAESFIMKNSYTVISSFSSMNSSLLSLTENRSRYMLPFGGRFRVADFTLRNSEALGASSTLLFTDRDDGLEEYVNMHDGSSSFRVCVSFSIEQLRDLLEENVSTHYIIYNGDSPSIIDFSALIDRFSSRKTDAVLYMISMNGEASMASKILVVKRRTLLKAVNRGVKENMQAPNLIEMVNNLVINQGIRKEKFPALYWPVNSIPDYYNITMDIIRSPEIFSLLYKNRIIKSRIKTGSVARLGKNADVVSSFVSDFCHINGRVENSVIYPGVFVDEKAVIKDSIILPFARIGRGAEIIRTVVDESTVYTKNADGTLEPNIGMYCVIGNEQDFISNCDFPGSVFSGITLIGGNCRIPDRLSVGCACYIASGMKPADFGRERVISDGLSVTGKPEPEEN